MPTTTAPLFTPYTLGALSLPNRIVMPPMTRSRSSQPGDVPNELMATYYAQRASAGLIISEGTWISPLGKGYAWTPGICTEEHIAGWRKVTDAVHAAGGRIFAQLWHVGRLSHSSLLDGQPPVSSSALQATGVNVYVIEADGKPGFAQASTPRALRVEEIHNIVDQYRQAARNAMAAGFDGVELHAANGYLVNQFIDSNANTRTDEYGGSLENRLRFLKEVSQSLVEGVGDASRVGIRLAPLTTLNGCSDADPETTYTAAATLLDHLRDAYKGCLIYAGNYTTERANTAIAEGWADLIGFGRTFIANPDLPERLRLGAPLNTPNRETFFGGDAKGLTDYPTLAEAATA
ncbi:MAG: alkene reductase [Paenalcaligenes sp.]